MFMPIDGPALNQVAFDIDDAIAMHLGWTHHLLRLVFLGDSPGADMMADDAHLHCPLAAWLQAAEQQLSRIDADLWAVLLQEHKSMHDAACNLCRHVCCHSHQKPAAIQQHLDDFERHQRNLISALQRLKTITLTETLTRDPLTQLPLRHGLHDAFHSLCAQANRRGETVYALLLDLDHFKSINDTYGHAAGDAVLREVARRLNQQHRQGEPLLRFGGEEFLLLLSAADSAHAYRIADRMLEAVHAHPVQFGAVPILVWASAGLARHHPETGETLAGLIQRADAALYEAKRSGRRRWIEAEEEPVSSVRCRDSKRSH